MTAKTNKTRKSGPGSSALSKKLRDELIHFMEYHPAKRFSRNLRSMLLEFLMFDGAIESSYLMDLLYDLDGLFRLLEAVEAWEDGKSQE